MEGERSMPWVDLIQSNGFWGLLGSALTVIGLFALGLIKVLTGKEIGFRSDLLQRVQHLEESLEAQRQHYEEQIADMRKRHSEQIAQIKDEYRRDLRAFVDRELDDGK